MAGFTKLFSSITDSTVWREPDRTRIVWITMLAMCDSDGYVAASVPGLADRARVPMDDCLKALEAFRAPDEWSRTKEFEGRRIVDVDGGWQLLNHAKYRAIQDAEHRREQSRVAMQRLRAQRLEATVSSVSNVSVGEQRFTHTEAEAEAELKDIAPAVLVGGADAYRVPDCPYQDLLDLYHAECPAMSRVLVMSSMRQKNLMARWRQVCAEDKLDKAAAIDWFRWYFQQAAASKFLTGRIGGKNGRIWKADFEWLVNGSNFAKVVEGRYSNERSAA